MHKNGPALYSWLEKKGGDFYFRQSWARLYEAVVEMNYSFFSSGRTLLNRAMRIGLVAAMAKRMTHIASGERQ